jgi:hypothetical protein
MAAASERPIALVDEQTAAAIGVSMVAVKTAGRVVALVSESTVSQLPAQVPVG